MGPQKVIRFRNNQNKKKKKEIKIIWYETHCTWSVYQEKWKIVHIHFMGHVMIFISLEFFTFLSTFLKKCTFPDKMMTK